MPPEVESLGAEPKVGRTYQVRCVRRRIDGYLMPILGPMHEDAEHINFPTLHWHIDFRFVTEAALESLTTFSGYREGDEFPYHAFAKVVAEPAYDTTKVLLRTRQCLRPMPDNWPIADWHGPLEAAHAGKRLCAGRICPHRGLPLAGVPVDADGIVVCPGHGLLWNTKTGALHRRCP